MNYHEDCPCCGTRITAYTVPLNRGLARAFLKFADARLRFGRSVEKFELELDHSQYGNFQKLRYFGLIALVDADVPEGSGRAWEMTPLGFNFLRGRATVLTPAGHFKGQPIPDDDLKWATHAPGRKPVSIQDVLGDEWKQRPEWVAEKKDLVA